MVELVSRERRQALAGHIQPDIREPLGRTAIADSAEPRDEMIFGGGHRLDLKSRRAVFARERPVARHGHGIGGERFELHLAAKAMRAADLGNADALRHDGLSKWKRVSLPARRRGEPRIWQLPRPWRLPRPAPCAACAGPRASDCCAARASSAPLGRESAARGRWATHLWRATPSPCRDQA